MIKKIRVGKDYGRAFQPSFTTTVVPDEYGPVQRELMRVVQGPLPEQDQRNLDSLIAKILGNPDIPAGVRDSLIDHVPVFFAQYTANGTKPSRIVDLFQKKVDFVFVVHAKAARLRRLNAVNSGE